MREEPTKVGYGLTRTGRRSGCSCCSFTMLALIALPIAAVAAFFLVV